MPDGDASTPSPSVVVDSGSLRVRAKTFTRWEFVLATVGYVSLGVGFGLNDWTRYPVFGVVLYALGLLCVGRFSSTAFRRGLRVGRDIDEMAMNGVAAEITRRVAHNLHSMAAAREGRN